LGLYRYGFNGKENDNEVKGIGNQQDYGMRIYDPRIGKFLSVDPLTKEYPHYTPYSYAGNKPIAFIDRDGEEESLELNLNRLDNALLDHKISKQEYQQRVHNMGASGLVGGAVAVDIYLTKGKITQFMLYSQISGAFYHNTGKTPEAKAAQEQNSREIIADAAFTWGFSKVIGVTAKIATEGGNSLYKTFNSASVRFSQTSVNDLDKIVTSMQKNDWKGEAIDIVKMKDGIYTTVDNTRLLAAQRVGINIQANAHNFDDLIPEEAAGRFLGKDGSVPTTWGEAVGNRIKSQNAQFRNTNENGSFVEPKIGTGKR